MRGPFCCMSAPTRKTCRAEAAVRARAVVARERSHLRAFSAPAWCRIATTHPRARAMHAPIPNGQPRNGEAVRRDRAITRQSEWATPCLQQPLVVLLQSIREWLEVCDLGVCCRRLHGHWPELRCVMLCISRCTPAHARRGAEASRAARTTMSAGLHLLAELLLKPSVAVADRSVALSQLLVQLGKIVCRMRGQWCKLWSSRQQLDRDERSR